MGHVPSGPVRLVGPSRHVQGRQHRGAPREGDPVVAFDPERTPRPSALGRVGEQRAATWYREHGFEILDRNWRRPDGEIDLVARSGGTVVFCEVKSRSSGRTGTPVEAVTRTKQLRLRRLAAEWLRTNRDRVGPARVAVRFDVASFVGGRLEVIHEAF